MTESPLSNYLGSDKLKNLAQGSIKKFDEISNAASSSLSQDRPISSGIFATPNHDAYRNAEAIKRGARQGNQRLAIEPAVARIVIHYPEKNRIEEYYICMHTPPTGVYNLASYYSPIGRLAELEIGEKFDMGEETGIEHHEGKEIIIIQHAKFNPVKLDSGWDSSNTTYWDAYDIAGKTIESLRGLIEKLKHSEQGGNPEDFINNLENNISDGIKKEILKKFAFPEQKILDSRQGNIFRLPLNYCLLLLGPAGTGKTTTLIKRLKLKQNLLDLENGMAVEEKNMIRRIFTSDEAFKASWLMFTPTNLLKNYLKEAISREDIDAPGEHVTTWHDFRYELGASILGILKTPSLESGFIADPDVITTQKGFEDWQELFLDYHTWLMEGYIIELKHALENLISHGFFKNSNFAAKFRDLASRDVNSGSMQIDKIFNLLIENKKKISELYKKEKDNIQKAIDKDLGRKLKNNETFLIEYADLLTALEKSESTEIDENEASDSDILDDEDDDKLQGSEKLKFAQKKYRSFMIWLSTKPDRFDSAKSNSKYTRQLKWLEDGIPAPEILKSIRHSVIRLKSLTVLHNPLNKFFSSIINRYGKFRRQMQAEGKYYQAESALRKKISLAELDFLIYTKLNIATHFLYYSQLDQNEALLTSSLRRIHNMYKAQIFVDEAPDFSPLQLGCMKLLAHPKLNSFFACGDFNQRLSLEGAKNTASIKSYLTGGTLKIEEVSIPYRQTKTLHKFSLKVLAQVTGNQNLENLPENARASEGPRPVLGENLKARGIAEWLAARIGEIGKILDGNIPSIAILVPSEEYVARIAKMLAETLSGSNIPVQACPEGKTTGGRAIRVFDIQHIKGLEFEGAFFVSLDQLSSLYPGLVNNYLYVGATRAAQFLGVTCEEKLPTCLSGNLRSEFVEKWH